MRSLRKTPYGVIIFTANLNPKIEEVRMDESPIKVGLVQINNSFSGLSYFPYSVGVLEAYATKYLLYPKQYKFLVPIFTRIRVSDAVERLLDADVVAFSVYVWNEQISLAIARELKRLRPNVVTIFGGPQVLDRSMEIESYLGTHPYVNFAAHGEGEHVFCSFLECFPTRDWASLSGVSYLTSDGLFVHRSQSKKIGDIDKLPSPYLDGIFEKLIEAHPQEQWIAIWETNRGCPFSCTFCGWGAAVNTKVRKRGLERLFAEVDWFADHDVAYISCADANFGIFPQDIEIAKYVAQVKSERGCFPSGFSVQNTKNATDRAYAIQKILSDSGLNRGVVLSIQSVDKTVLANIKRENIKLETYDELQRRFRRDGVETMSDLILGLPGETYDSFVNGVSTLIERGQHNRIQFNNLSILPDAEMWDPAYRRKYGMEIVVNRIINIHGQRDDFEEIPEYQPLIIATTAMPRPDWIRARAFGWTAGLLHFDKVLQIVLVVVHEFTGITYRELLELFTVDRAEFLPATDFPILAHLREFFRAKAEDIQKGGEEYCYSKKWLDIWWPADEYAMIEIVSRGELTAFYREALVAIRKHIEATTGSIDPALVEILEDAISLNQALIKVPFQKENLDVEVRHNILDVWNGILTGQPIPFIRGMYRYRIDRTSQQWASWDVWCKEVIWYGNKRGAYLYGNEPVVQLAGHF